MVNESGAERLNVPCHFTSPPRFIPHGKQPLWSILLEVEMTDKERIIVFIQKLIPDDIVCGHIAVTFNDDGSAVIIIDNKEDC